MPFTPISIDDYVKVHLKNNPEHNEQDLRKMIHEAFSDYLKGVRCSCGKDLWVIGSAFMGKGCFTCLTGQSTPSDEFELETALEKRDHEYQRRDKEGDEEEDDYDFLRGGRYFDDDGNELDPNLIKKPSLCTVCAKDGDPREEILCNLLRLGHEEGEEFICHAFRRKG